MKTALISGITGQTGSFLAELLLDKDYTVHGIMRRSSSFNTGRIEHLYSDKHASNTKLFLHYGDLADYSSLTNIMRAVRPDEIYNLAAQSHVGTSFKIPEYTGDIVGLGAARMLEAYRETCPEARFYQASSSELFGNSPSPQNEKTPFDPRSPYAAAKAYAYYMATQYRNGYGLFVSNGILFNHESERRLETFVTRKITMGAARIKRNLQETLYLGNLGAKRDWGYAKDYAEAIYRILQHDQPDDFVIGTGETHTVQELVEVTFAALALDWANYVEQSSEYFRPLEVDELCADISKAKKILGWEPKTKFNELVMLMLNHDLALLDSRLLLK
jgi:GDPmannose 4,6-dehydratase